MTACWDVINTEWDPDQETVNFGTRQFVQDGSALYDVVTLATVECSNPVIFLKIQLYFVEAAINSQLIYALNIILYFHRN